jgi:hypothetical protein
MSRIDVKRTLRIAALTSHLVLIVKSPQFERSDPGDRLFVRWQPLRLVDSLGSNLTDGWPGAEQQTNLESLSRTDVGGNNAGGKQVASVRRLF